MKRDGKMGVHLDGSKSVGVSRLEVIEGLSGRRRRTKAERARIAAESMMLGVTVADVARQHGTTRWQIYDWRKQINDNLLNGIHSSTQNFAPSCFRSASKHT